jgi:hypothetical protein
MGSQKARVREKRFFAGRNKLEFVGLIVCYQLAAK